MPKLTKLTARQILDSRGNPTVEVRAFSGKDFAVASVPSGASTGSHEAIELRDHGKTFSGASVAKAVRNIETKIARKLKGLDVYDQEVIDLAMVELDGSEQKGRLGGNSILGVSLAIARLSSQLSGQPLYLYLAKTYGYRKPSKLPTPLFNVINGGLHADSGTDVQEFFLIPKKGNYWNRLDAAHKVISALKLELAKKKLSVGVGDEGGFAPKLNSNEKALRLLHSAVHHSGLRLGRDIALGIDAAATVFFDSDKEIYRFKADKRNFKPASVYQLYARWIKKYHLEVIEDGCSEDDLLGWQKLTVQLGKKICLVGDDLFVTNPYRLQAGIIAGVANAVLIKPNQIGTLTETMATISLAQRYGYKVVVSHRSGETVDDFIADLAVAVGADYIKAGSLARGERVAKYNRLLAIEEELS